jgi:hypothetical protein
MVSDSRGMTASLTTVLRVAVGQLIITDASGHTPPNPPSGTVGTSYQFFFTAQGGSQSGYTWSAQGTLPPGLTAQNGPGCPASCALLISGTPTQGGTFSFAVMVRDSLGNTTSQGATITVNTGQPPTITTTRLPKATVGSPYSITLAASGGTPSYQWSLIGNSPDPGLQLSPTGVLSGIPTLGNDCPTGATDGGGIWVGGSYPTTYFTVRVTDSAGQSVTQSLCLVSYYPKPVITGYSPAGVVADGAPHTITVLGQNFRSNARIVLSAAIVPTSYVSGTALTFTVDRANSADSCPLRATPGGPLYCEGTRSHSVIQPDSDPSDSVGGFMVYDPPPVISGVDAYLNNSTAPCTPYSGCQLVIQGDGLNYNSIFQVVETGETLNRLAVPATAPPWTTETVVLFHPTAPGTYTLRITNPYQPGGGGATATMQFAIQP